MPLCCFLPCCPVCECSWWCLFGWSVSDAEQAGSWRKKLVSFISKAWLITHSVLNLLCINAAATTYRHTWLELREQWAELRCSSIWLIFSKNCCRKAQKVRLWIRSKWHECKPACWVHLHTSTCRISWSAGVSITWRGTGIRSLR